jgi:membrane protein implicated in regulation of membrane protease activity
MAIRLWDPTGFWPSAIGGLIFGIGTSVIASLVYGTWWYLLVAVPMAVAWAVLWRRWYPRVYEHLRRGFDKH